MTESSIVTDTSQTEEDHDDEDHHDAHEHSSEADGLMLPEIAAIDLDGQALNVVATTSIIGDVIGNIGGDQIELVVLMAQGEDPHSYETTPQDLVALEEADLIFVNGWGLEERLSADIEENFADKMIAISAGIDPLDLEEDDHASHGHNGADPHVWLDIHNVERWAENTADVLSEADPAHADSYQANLSAYSDDLEALEDEIESLLEPLPMESRKLVTNHSALGYFAQAYGFEIAGTILPAASTNADPSAGELAELVETMEAENVCTIFGETTDSNALAKTVAAELDTCDAVHVLTIYTGALGEGDAGSYIGMFRNNVQTIVDGLQDGFNK